MTDMDRLVFLLVRENLEMHDEGIYTGNTSILCGHFTCTIFFNKGEKQFSLSIRNTRDLINALMRGTPLNLRKELL